MRSPRSVRLVAVALAWSVALGSTSAAAQPAERLDPAATEFTPDEFLAVFDDAVLDGLAPIEGPPPAILGSADADARIRAIGEERGYRRRPNPDRDLVPADGVRLQPEAAEGWESLQAAAAAAGHSLTVTSGYRSVSTQIFIFKRKLTGTSDEAFDRRLRTVAVPGYSKHHTGYAIDIRSSTGRGFAFANTAAYAWLSDDNFANAKRHGWVPSYPEGTGPAGPVPEPWELVWVGVDNIVCADFEPTADRPLCDTDGSTFAPDARWMLDEGISTGCRVGRFCTTSPVSRGELATFLWRLSGEPDAAAASFDDVEGGRFYTTAVGWLSSTGVTTGTSPSTYEPERDVTRAEFVTMLWRLAGNPAAAGGGSPFTDVDAAGFAAPAIVWAAAEGITRGATPTTFEPDRPATRGEAAAFIRRFAER